MSGSAVATQAVVFPGQGAQKVGMAKDFVAAFPESAAVFEAASEATAIDMANLCFSENEQINQTEFTQPALLTAEIAMFSALKAHFGFFPTWFAGHSLGEYTALVAAGVIPLAAAVQIVRKRGALMQQAVPLGVGAMAAFIADDLAACDLATVVQSAGAEVANFNSAKQVVISGRKDAVERASTAMKEQYPSVTVIPLNVSAPFHSSLMRDIEPEFEQYLRSFAGTFSLTNVNRVVSNFNGGFHTAETLLTHLVRQISGSVRWEQNMQTLAGVTLDMIEVGPNRVLTKFLGTINVTAKAITDERSLKKVFGDRSAVAA